VNARNTSVRLGLSRAWIEYKHSLTSKQDLTWLVVINAILLTVLFLQRDATVDGVRLATATLPSLMGMSVATAGLMGIGTMLSAEREDGTLLRAKAIPNGMIGYLVSRLVRTGTEVGLGLVLTLTLGSLIIGGLPGVGAADIAMLVGFAALGLLATLPWGAVIGSLVRSSSAGFGLTFLPISGLVAISGIFYPISGMPGWLQDVAQLFPLYWLGLGMRSTLLPDGAAAAEIGGSWRHLEAIGVLGLWAVVGLVVAPAVLRRMARRESGSAVAERRQKVLQRIG
jgi:ABC-2 type transport system permease protein